jgi:hypothetical protein
MCSAEVPAGLGRQSSSLVHHVVWSLGLLAVCIIAVTQPPPLRDTAGVLSDAVSWNQPAMSIYLQMGSVMYSVPACSPFLVTKKPCYSTSKGSPCQCSKQYPLGRPLLKNKKAAACCEALPASTVADFRWVRAPAFSVARAAAADVPLVAEGPLRWCVGQGLPHN